MQSINFEDAVRKIVAADDRYQFDAYLFVQEAICYTQKTLGRKGKDNMHVGGRELLEGIRESAVKTFGPMADAVFADWGIFSCEDFGEIVYNLIEHKQATQSPTDSRADFKDGYDFYEAFRKPFLPQKKGSVQASASAVGILSQD